MSSLRTYISSLPGLTDEELVTEARSAASLLSSARKSGVKRAVTNLEKMQDAIKGEKAGRKEAVGNPGESTASSYAGKVARLTDSGLRAENKKLVKMLRDSAAPVRHFGTEGLALLKKMIVATEKEMRGRSLVPNPCRAMKNPIRLPFEKTEPYDVILYQYEDGEWFFEIRDPGLGGTLVYDDHDGRSERGARKEALRVIKKDFADVIPNPCWNPTYRRPVPYRKVKKDLKKAGWTFRQGKGSHDVWEAPTGVSVSIPRKARGGDLIGQPYLRQIRLAEEEGKLQFKGQAQEEANPKKKAKKKNPHRRSSAIVDRVLREWAAGLTRQDIVQMHRTMGMLLSQGSEEDLGEFGETMKRQLVILEEEADRRNVSLRPNPRRRNPCNEMFLVIETRSFEGIMSIAPYESRAVAMSEAKAAQKRYGRQGYVIVEKWERRTPGGELERVEKVMIDRPKKIAPPRKNPMWIGSRVVHIFLQHEEEQAAKLSDAKLKSEYEKAKEKGGPATQMSDLGGGRTVKQHSANAVRLKAFEKEMKKRGLSANPKMKATKKKGKKKAARRNPQGDYLKGVIKWYEATCYKDGGKIICFWDKELEEASRTIKDERRFVCWVGILLGRKIFPHRGQYRHASERLPKDLWKRIERLSEDTLLIAREMSKSCDRGIISTSTKRRIKETNKEYNAVWDSSRDALDEAVAVVPFVIDANYNNVFWEIESALDNPKNISKAFDSLKTGQSQLYMGGSNWDLIHRTFREAFLEAAEKSGEVPGSKRTLRELEGKWAFNPKMKATKKKPRRKKRMSAAGRGAIGAGVGALALGPIGAIGLGYAATKYRPVETKENPVQKTESYGGHRVVFVESKGGQWDYRIYKGTKKVHGNKGFPFILGAAAEAKAWIDGKTEKNPPAKRKLRRNQPKMLPKRFPAPSGWKIFKRGFEDVAPYQHNESFISDNGEWVITIVWPQYEYTEEDDLAIWYQKKSEWDEDLQATGYPWHGDPSSKIFDPDEYKGNWDKTIDAAVDWLKKMYSPTGKRKPLSAQAADALKHINRQRARHGLQGPLDPVASGWLDEEVIGAAKREGWKPNPRKKNPPKNPPTKRKLHKSFAKWVDAQKMAKKHPEAFEAPTLAGLKRDVRIGDLVKWNIGAERLWLLVVDVEGDTITGLISSNPLDKKYSFDDVVRIKFKHVYDYKKGSKKSTARAEAFLDGLVEKEKSVKTKKRRKKKSKKETLIGKSRRLWDGYVEKPTKKALKSVLDHLEDMENSTAKTVKAEWRRAKRAAKDEAKRLGMKF